MFRSYTGYERRSGKRMVTVEVVGGPLPAEMTTRPLPGWHDDALWPDRTRRMVLAGLILTHHLGDQPLGEALADQFEPVLAAHLDWRRGWSMSSRQIARWLEAREMQPGIAGG